MVKFSVGDDIEKQVSKVIVHEFSRCTLAFDFFIMYGPRNHNQFEHQDMQTKLLRYNSYALFIQHLYEYFIACLKRDYRETKEIDPVTVDVMIITEVNKILRKWREGIDGGWAPKWANHRSYYEDQCPDEFGKDFRQIRNSLSHADYRRIHGGNRITLTEFYKKYHKYVILLYYNGREWWSIQKNEKIDLGDITDFSTLIYK